MLSFRERLSEIKEEKLKKNIIHEEAVESILEKLLKYFESQSLSKILKESQISFGFGGNTVYANDVMGKTLFKENFSDSKEAVSVLIHLEKYFLDEEYELATNATAVKDGYFKVKIKP